MTLEDTNIALVRQYYDEIFHRGNLDKIGEFVDANFNNHNPPPGANPVPGVEGARQFWSMIRRAFPDIRVDIEVIIAEGDTVAEHSVIHATNTGPWMNMPGTGKQVVWDMSNMYRIQRGKITDRWGAFDQMALMRQLGLMPDRSH